MSWLEIVNKFFLQWFFVRLKRNEFYTIEELEFDEYIEVEDGGMSIRGKPKNIITCHQYSLVYFIKPLTGWSNKYVILNSDNKIKYLDITKKRIKC